MAVFLTEMVKILTEIPKILTKIAKILTERLLTNRNTRGALASGAIQNHDMDCQLCLAVVFCLEMLCKIIHFEQLQP